MHLATADVLVKGGVDGDHIRLSFYVNGMYIAGW